MTLSYGIDHVSSNTTESITTVLADKTTMVLVSSDVDVKTGRATATYVLATGDPNHPAQVIFAVDPVVNSNKSRYGSVTFKTWSTQTDSVTGVVTYWPVQATMSFVIQNGAPVQLADFNKLIAAVFSYTFASASSGTRDTAWLQDLLFGSPQVK